MDIGYDIETYHDLSSDHNPVIMNIGDNSAVNHETITRKTTNWPLFHRKLEEIASPIPIINTAVEIEDAIGVIESDIHTALQQATTTKTYSTTGTHDIPLYLKEFIREKRRAKKRAHRTLDPQELAHANALQNNVREELCKHYNARWDAKIIEVEEDNTALWKLTKCLRKKSKPYPPIHSDQGVVYENQDKAAFARNMERQCSINISSDDDSDWEEEVERRARRTKRIVTNIKVKPATDQELKAIIKQLPVNKAPGLDLISNRMIKLFPRKSRIAVLNVINAILREAYFPTRWKTALLVMLPKDVAAFHKTITALAFYPACPKSLNESF